MKRIVGITVLLLVAVFAYAAKHTSTDVHPKIELVSIKALKTQEQPYDEIYATVTSLEGETKHQRIPQDPLSWTSAALQKVKDVVLWEGILQNNQGATLLISFVEQDAAPWNADDLIGFVRLNLKNNKGVLLSKWTLPNQNVTVASRVGTVANRQLMRFEMQNENKSRYEVVIALTRNAR